MKEKMEKVKERLRGRTLRLEDFGDKDQRRLLELVRRGEVVISGHGSWSGSPYYTLAR